MALIGHPMGRSFSPAWPTCFPPPACTFQRPPSSRRAPSRHELAAPLLASPPSKPARCPPFVRVSGLQALPADALKTYDHIRRAQAILSYRPNHTRTDATTPRSGPRSDAPTSIRGRVRRRALGRSFLGGVPPRRWRSARGLAYRGRARSPRRHHVGRVAGAHCGARAALVRSSGCYAAG